jgi:hypothetical protein
MVTTALWACLGFMSFTGITGDLPAGAFAVDHIQVAGEAGAANPLAAEPVETGESEVSSPPMAMDDPGTPGNRGIEVNFVGTAERIGNGRGTETLLDANYGIGDRIQLKYERPYVTTREDGVPEQGGLGATIVGVKWRFVDSHGWQLAFYPAYRFDDAFTVKDEQGNPLEREGHLAYFPLLVSKTVARVYTVAANFGYSYNTDHLTKDCVVAFGLGRALGTRGRILGEVYSERDDLFNNRQTDVRLGIFQAVLPESFSRNGFEFPVFASFGHSVGATEAGETALSFTFGMSILKVPKGE